jgi:hypothetical protein
MKLEQLAEVIRGITTTKGELAPAAGNPYRIVQIRHIRDGVVASPKDLKAVYLSKERRPQRFGIQAGDILVAMLGENPKVALVNTSPRACLADKSIAIVRPQSAAAGKRIAKHLASEAGQNELRSIQSGVTIPHMKLADLKAVEIP